nr:hypothetical protein Iba_chr13bCG1680 [Ipomoea batatas]
MMSVLLSSIAWKEGKMNMVGPLIPQGNDEWPVTAFELSDSHGDFKPVQIGPFGHYMKFKAPSVTVLQEIPDYMENNLESPSFLSHNVIRQGFVDFDGEFINP